LPSTFGAPGALFCCVDFEFFRWGFSMSRSLVETGNLVVNLTPRPIEPSWIIEGKPDAQWCVLSKSADGLASTMVWECSEGKFNWYYDFDETILILEGSIVLENDTMSPTRYGPGDVVFFKDGAHARWHVEGRVKKLAFCRKTQPVLLGFALRAFFRIRRTLMQAAKRQTASLASG
jgi:uncharacterized protein